MQRKFLVLLSVFLLAWTAVSSSNHGHRFNRHAELAVRADGNLQLFKRTTGATWKYYDVEETGNAGSCGLKHVNTDFTVAMNVAQMNPAWCFKTITMTSGGKTTTATISDTCLGCPYGGLDLTEGLFAFFLGHWPGGGGVLIGDWEFTDATPANPVAPTPVSTTKPPLLPPATSSPPKSAVSSPKASSSSFSTASRTASTSSTSSTSTSISSSEVVPSSTSINYLTGISGGLAIPTGVIDTQGSPFNLGALNLVIVQLGGLAVAAENS